MDDLISRQAAIKDYQRVCAIVTCGDCPFHIVDGAFTDCRLERWLKALPSAQRWILCTDRLPEDERTVWVTVKGHDVIIVEDGETLEEAVDRIMKIRWVTQGYYCREEGEEGWNDPMFGTPLMVQPIAWMDIDKPEPWEGKDEEIKIS